MEKMDWRGVFVISNIEQELSIRGENIQRIYDYYINNKLLINRKYLDLRQVFGHTLPKCFLGATSRMDCSTSQVARQSEKSL